MSINSVVAEEILDCYAALGWKQAERREDEQFENVEHFEFFRPHGIAHKDRLQLLQVYLETEVNKIARITVNKHARSLAAGLFSWIAGIALVTLGVLVSVLFYQKMHAAAVVLGIVAGVFGFAVLVASAVFVVKAFKKENEFYENSVRDGLNAMEDVYREARLLTEPEDE